MNRIEQLPDDGRDHEFCWSCGAETVEHVDDGETVKFHCRTCESLEERSLYVPANYVSWFDDEERYWHESAGVFVSRNDGRFLFYKRRIYPIALTIPAGHVELGETPSGAAAREMFEETGLAGIALVHVADLDITHDPCSAGAEGHRWHAFQSRIDRAADLRPSHEGSAFIWLTLTEALQEELIPPVRATISGFSALLQQRAAGRESGPT